MGHRVGEILELTNVSSWHWVSTKDNVADEATRDDTDIKISNDSRWFKGPNFLELEYDGWPKDGLDYVAANDDLELKKEFSVFTISEKKAENKLQEVLPDVNRFSKYLRLIRSTAWVLHFIKRCRSHTTKSELAPEELEDAELL